MRKLLAVFIFAIPLSLFGQTAPVSGYCTLGGSKANVSGLGSTNYQQGIIPGCTVSVFIHGTSTLATIYADSTSTPLSNPFTANLYSSPNSGGWIFWASTGACYDVVGSGGIVGSILNTYPAPVTLVETCPGGGGGGTPNGSLGEPQVYGTGPAFLGSPAWRDATAFAGADVTAKILAAMQALPAIGGTVDARGFTTAQLSTVGATTIANSGSGSITLL